MEPVYIMNELRRNFMTVVGPNFLIQETWW